ncbi:hypothetical protein B0G57_1206 [Trinickia symbiotica]|uniref:Uncharacterized protein n=1 Tax=Trinickia symbiotica TaxID=863227 RepID=A0A2N7WV37_9BURK|nr:hypothetical protein [Trinickia symbiotica]PMS33201.1 hypothetical protein C0Z20_24640 [Trinickia symbiotica]PPK42214.1 hypothetical protein B0G57_1206 [Trinickia symbiotica]
MVTTIRNIKIPKNIMHDRTPYPVKKANAAKQRAREAADAAARNVDPVYASVLSAGRKGTATDQVIPSSAKIKPSVKGIAYKNKFERIGKSALALANGLDAIVKIQAMGDAAPRNLRDIADATLQRIACTIPKINAALDSLLSEQATTGGQYGSRGATANSNIEEQARAIAKIRCAEMGSVSEEDEEAHYQAALKELQRNAMDSRSGQYVAMDHETRLQMEVAAGKVARLKVAQAVGDAGDIVRAKHGMEPRTLVGDEVYALFKGLRVTTEARRK